MSPETTKMERVLVAAAKISCAIGAVGISVFVFCLVAGVLGAEWAQGREPPRAALFALALMAVSGLGTIISMVILSWRGPHGRRA